MVRLLNLFSFALIIPALVVSVSAAPVVSVAPSSVVFNYTSGGVAPALQTVTVSADQSSSVTGYTIAYTTTAGWLTIFPLTSTLPQTMPVAMTVYAIPTGLAAGTYSATVSLTTFPAADPSSLLSFTVFLTVTGGSGGGTYNESISVIPTNLAFTFQPGGAVPAAQSLAVTTSDSLAVTTTVTTNDGNPWLLVSPVSSPTPGNLSVSVNPATLPSGTYTGSLTITAPNTVTQVPVTLTVGSVGLTSNPTSLSISEPQNYGLSAYQPLTITAATPLPISVSAAQSDTGNWLQVDINNATTPATIGVRANDSSLAQGTYTGSVTVQAGPSNVLQVPVTLTVGIPAPIQLQPSVVSFIWQINDPLPGIQTGKVVSLTGSSVPYAVSVKTNDGANWLAATPVTGTTPGNISVSISPSTLTPGSYTGFVNVTPTLANASPQPIMVSLTVKAAPIPTIKGVVSSASYAGGAVAPGELVTFFGSSIGPATLTVSPAGTAPATLANTSVTFDGIPAPVYYASSTQTSVQVPYNIAIGQTVAKLTYNGITSAASALVSQTAYPGLFTTDSTGQRQLAALNADLSLNSAANPVARGTTLVLYGTGEGQTAPGSVEGVRVPIIAPLPQTALAVTVTIGGQNSTLQYAGETPGLLSGLMQINVLVPPNAPVGPTVPVQVTINGQTTQSNVTVAIK